MTASVKPPPALKKRVLTLKQHQLPNFSLGAQGEASALHFLQTKGYQILDTNVSVANHEIDIVALDSQLDEVVFIEVKTRSQPFYGNPSQAVNYRKLKSLRRVAKLYQKLHQLEKDYRFDIIAILPGQIEHFENITWSGRR